MARIGSEAFAVFNGFEVVHLAGICSSIAIDAGPHGDLCIDAAVVAMGFDRLRDEQNRDAEQLLRQNISRCGSQPKPRPEALEGSPAIRNSM